MNRRSRKGFVIYATRQKRRRVLKIMGIIGILVMLWLARGSIGGLMGNVLLKNDRFLEKCVSSSALFSSQADRTAIIQSFRLPFTPEKMFAQTAAAFTLIGEGIHVANVGYNIPLADLPGRPSEEANHMPQTKPESQAGQTVRENNIPGADSNNNIIVRNETKYSYDINEILKEKLSFTKTDKPRVLIVHTHATEAFYPVFRSTDINENIVRVGTELKANLEEMGIQSIHVTTQHDAESFNGAYARSLDTIEYYLKKYPSIQVVMDVHRDAITENGEKLKLTTTIDGKKTAQLMLVVGTNEGGLKHDNWRDNFAFAVKLENEFNTSYPKFARPINLRRERFNQHTSPAALIVEVGGDGNTMEEALNASLYLARALKKIIG